MNREDFEEHALAALDGLYAYALKLSRDREDAADLVQETFAKALKALDRFREPAAVRPMLFRILRNCFVDSWRKKRRRPRLAILPDPETAEPSRAQGTGEPAFQADDLEEAFSEEVRSALDALEDSMREALWLREVEDFSYTEISETMDVPIGTVRSRLARARAQMAAKLQDAVQSRKPSVSRADVEGLQ